LGVVAGRFLGKRRKAATIEDVHHHVVLPNAILTDLKEFVLRLTILYQKGKRQQIKENTTKQKRGILLLIIFGRPDSFFFLADDGDQFEFFSLSCLSI
jgi:hypothetical protein